MKRTTTKSEHSNIYNEAGVNKLHILSTVPLEKMNKATR